jgi:hypothetical protein
VSYLSAVAQELQSSEPAGTVRSAVSCVPDHLAQSPVRVPVVDDVYPRDVNAVTRRIRRSRRRHGGLARVSAIGRIDHRRLGLRASGRFSAPLAATWTRQQDRFPAMQGGRRVARATTRPCPGRRPARVAGRRRARPAQPLPQPQRDPPPSVSPVVRHAPGRATLTCRPARRSGGWQHRPAVCSRDCLRGPRGAAFRVAAR